MASCRRQSRWIGWKMLALALALAWITARPAQAGILAGDPNAMVGWDGSVSLSATYSPYSLSAVVDYAVYAKGSFDQSFPGSDPSNGACYVYAYQFFNSEPASTVSIKQFSVGLNGHDQVANQAQLADPSGPAGLPSAPQGL